ncbi:MAG: 1-acyl-sn-glycerol-3-phosphate acyltransferase [Thermanaerothrix sp.]|nr:1-acyl-sn-glycerol-3-phosphate acyltransferase [Thermanaerothrix sp.]
MKGLKGRSLPSPLIVASNHCSHLDPPLVGSFFPGDLCYLAKEELFRSPFMGWMLTHLGACPVRREDAQGAGGVMRLMLKILRDGRSLLIFPEGTRSMDGRLQPLEEGVAFLSLKANVPILPVFVRGTFEAFPKGAKMPRRGDITLSFGDIISPEPFLNAHGNGREARGGLLSALEASFRELERDL